MEILGSLMAIGIMVYGLSLMTRGPTFANRLVGRGFGRINRLTWRAVRYLLRLAWRLELAFLRVEWRAIRWFAQTVGRYIRMAWRQHPHASGFFWGALAGAAGLAIILWITAS